MSLPEYLGYVKAFHPIVKQANLKISESEAKLLKERGAFDPKFEMERSQKNYKGIEYYDKLIASFKIPTWYGIEFKGNFEDNEGVYLNPEASVPDNGLYSVGVSVSQGIIAGDHARTGHCTWYAHWKNFASKTHCRTGKCYNDCRIPTSSYLRIQNGRVIWLRRLKRLRIQSSDTVTSAEMTTE